MRNNLKKIFLSLLLLFITFSFSGCLGIGGSRNAGTSAERNDSQGIFKTTDGGKTWEHKVTIEGSQTRLDQIKIISMAIDPENTKVLYVGTVGDGIYKSENGGDSWYQVGDQNNRLRATSTVYDMVAEGGNSNIIYAATLNENRGVLLKSEDAGKSWAESYISTESGKQINRVQIDPVSKNTVYIGTEQGGLIKSMDRGNNWEIVSWFAAGVKDFVVDYHDTKGIVVLTHSGLFKTTDGGANQDTSWTNLTKETSKFLNIKDARTLDSIYSITIDNQDPLMIYMTYLNSVSVTHDGGITWTTLKTITPPMTSSKKKKIPEIKKIGIVGDTIYYGAGNALYKSNDKGQTWSNFDIPISGDVKCTVSDPKDHNIIYVGALYE